jgi:hypothetical protein
MQFGRFNKYYEKKSRYDDHENYFYYGNSYSKRYPDHAYGKEHLVLKMISKIWNNRKLRVFFIFLLLFLIATLVLIVIALIPFIIRIADSFLQGGFKGIIESATAIMDKLWNGSGN